MRMLWDVAYLVYIVDSLVSFAIIYPNPVWAYPKS